MEGLPLAVYRDRSLYTMRTDALDRFGTRFERRFTRVAMLNLMRRAGLEHIELSDAPRSGAPLPAVPDPLRASLRGTVLRARGRERAADSPL